MKQHKVWVPMEPSISFRCASFSPGKIRLPMLIALFLIGVGVVGLYLITERADLFRPVSRDAAQPAPQHATALSPPEEEGGAHMTTTPSQEARTIETPSHALPRDAAEQPGEAARAVIRRFRRQESPFTLEDLHTSGERLLATHFFQDAQLIFYYAATQGHLPAMILLAEANDPLQPETNRRFLAEPDPEQAYKWYKRARAQEFAEAGVRLEALRAWAEEAARSGDKTAKRFLFQWLTQSSGN